MLDRNEFHIEIQLPFYDLSHHVCANTSKSRKKEETWKLLAQRTSICRGSVGCAHGTNSLSIIQEQGLQDGFRYMLVVYPWSFSSCFSVWHCWSKALIRPLMLRKERLNTVIPALSLHSSLFSLLISNFIRDRGPIPLSFIKNSLNLWVYLTLIYSSIDSTSWSHRGVTCICGKMPWPQIQTGKLGPWPDTL